MGLECRETLEFLLYKVRIFFPLKCWQFLPCLWSITVEGIFSSILWVWAIKRWLQSSSKKIEAFLLSPRLQMLFMCSTIVESMRWYEEEHSNYGNLRHLIDDQAWKVFGRLHMRLGLVSGGFNSFRTIGINS